MVSAMDECVKIEYQVVDPDDAAVIDTVTADLTSITEDGGMACNLCGAIFTKPSNRLRHLRNKHGVSTQAMLVRGYLCSHPGCKDNLTRYLNNDIYRRHLNDHHEVPDILKLYEIEFSTLKDFDAWKNEIERTDCAHFSSERGTSRSGGAMRTFYECHRSGMYIPRGVGKRKLKSQGSCKSGVHCPASIIVDQVDAVYKVKYYPTHFGHERDLKHISLTAEERREIAGQLIMGIPPETILENLKAAAGDGYSRIHMLSRQDIYNIGLCNGITAKVAAESVINSFEEELTNEWANVNQGDHKSTIHTLLHELSNLTEENSVSSVTSVAIIRHLQIAKKLFSVTKDDIATLSKSAKNGSVPRSRAVQKRGHSGRPAGRTKKDKIAEEVNEIEWSIIPRPLLGGEEVVIEYEDEVQLIEAGIPVTHIDPNTGLATSGHPTMIYQSVDGTQQLQHFYIQQV